jgi:4-amino-4-deoxy-L-arabinose transferase-like glycosyltransferase
MVLAALAIRLAVIPFVCDEWMSPYNMTHFEQGNVAQSLLEGRGFSSPFASNQPSAIMPPMYPLILAGIFAIFGIHTTTSILAALALNCLFSALACLPLVLVAERAFGRRVALWTGWAWVFSPYGVYFSAEWPWATHLLLLCLCWMLVLAQKMESSGNWRLWASFGLLSGFAALAEPSVLILVPWLILLACYGRNRLRASWFWQAATSLVLLIAMLAPWTIRNAMVFHRLIPLRDGMGLEMWLGNNGSTRHWRDNTYHPNHNAAELAEYNQAGELAYMDHKQRQADDYIHAHRGWYAWMCLRRAGYLWTGYWSLDAAYLEGESLDPPNIFFWTTLVLLTLAGLILAWKQHQAEVLRFGGILFLYPIPYYFSHPETYRMRPLDPLVLMLCCYALLNWRKKPEIEGKM